MPLRWSSALLTRYPSDLNHCHRTMPTTVPNWRRPRHCHALVERAGPGFAADRDRRASDTVLQNDVDDAADGVVAIEHRAAVAAGDLDSLDRIERDGRKIDLRHVDVVQSPSVNQDERIGGGEGSKSAEVDAGLRAVDATKQACQLHARRLGNDFRQRLRRRVGDIVSGDDGRRVPTMPSNCRTAAPPLPVPPIDGEAPERRMAPRSWYWLAAGRTTRRLPVPSSVTGLARVRFSSPGELTSMGGSCSEDAVCCALAAEIPNEMNGRKKT